jgi:CRP/FNR family cyclic AMP-dependent transcriptional regulator
MLSPYGLEIIEGCFTCKVRSGKIFCDLPETALEAFEQIRFSSAYPKGAVLFVEGQEPRGIFIVCQGRVKLSVSASDGKTLILEVAEAGEVLGLAAAVSNKPYAVTAETIDPSQVNFIRRDDFLRFMRDHPEVGLRVSQQLSENYHTACREIRSLALSHSAAEKLARLLLEWAAKSGEEKKAEPRITVAVTHEEMAQMIGTSRETVTRIFAEMKKREMIQVKGSTLVIRNKGALMALAAV